jgi:hypothetical protein
MPDSPALYFAPAVQLIDEPDDVGMARADNF